MTYCILLGAITPDHDIQRLNMDDYMSMTRSRENREALRKWHGR